MANIGKFNVQLTATDEEFRRTLDQSIQKIVQFKQEAQKPALLGGSGSASKGILQNLSNDLLKASRLFGGATRDATKYLRTVTSGLGAIGGAAGAAVAGVTAAVAAVALLGTTIANAGQASRDFRLTQLQEAERILAEIAGKEFVLPRELMTSAQAGDELYKALGRVGEALGEFVGFSFADLKLGLADLIESAATWFLGEEALAEVRRRDAMAKQALERARKMKEEAEKRKQEAEERRRQEEQEIARIQREMEADVERLKRRGEELAKAVRTPVEEFRDTIEELKQLLNGTFIDTETFDRNVAAAVEKLKQAKMQLEPEPTQRFAGAVQAGTAAEVSARLKAEAEQVRQTQLAERQVEISEDILRELQAMNVKLRGTGSDVVDF